MYVGAPPQLRPFSLLVLPLGKLHFHARYAAMTHITFLESMSVIDIAPCLHTVDHFEA